MNQVRSSQGGFKIIMASLSSFAAKTVVLLYILGLLYNEFYSMNMLIIYMCFGARGVWLNRQTECIVNDRDKCACSTLDDLSMLQSESKKWESCKPWRYIPLLPVVLRAARKLLVLMMLIFRGALPPVPDFRAPSPRCSYASVFWSTHEQQSGTLQSSIAVQCVRHALSCATFCDCKHTASHKGFFKGIQHILVIDKYIRVSYSKYARHWYLLCNDSEALTCRQIIVYPWPRVIGHTREFPTRMIGTYLHPHTLKGMLS